MYLTRLKLPALLLLARLRMFFLKKNLQPFLAIFVLLLLGHQLYLLPYRPYRAGNNSLTYTVFVKGMEKYKIDSPSIKDHYQDEKVKSYGLNSDEFLFTKEYLLSVLDIPPETAQNLKKSHHGFVHEHIDRLINKVKISTFGIVLESSPEWEEYAGSCGYVLIGGGKYSWLSFLVVKQIRATGSTLPIEVFIPSAEEYEERFCEEVLPRHNARCNVLDSGLHAHILEHFKVKGYQFKMLSILTSRFENVMYMDSDLFPMKDVEFLFESKLFKETGLFLWPDHWARTTNPLFHEIAEHPVLEKKIRYSKYDIAQAESKNEELPELLSYDFLNSNFHDFEGSLPNPTSEAGILLVNKTSHKRTLLLALYYNIFGPDFYYPLMTQGGAGEGDKETFIAAAVVMNEPYFQTLKQFSWIGYNSQDEGRFVSKALGHYDPTTSKEDSKDARLLFMHCSYPKYYTDWFYNNHDLIYKDEKTHIRMYEGIYENIGYDADLRLQQFFVQGVCKDYYKDGKSEDGTILEADEWAGNFLKYIGDDVETNNQRCLELYLPHLQWLKETTKYPGTLLH